MHCNQQLWASSVSHQTMKLHRDLNCRHRCTKFDNCAQASLAQPPLRVDPLMSVVVYQVRDQWLRELDDSEKHCNEMLRLLVSRYCYRFNNKPSNDVLQAQIPAVQHDTLTQATAQGLLILPPNQPTPAREIRTRWRRGTRSKSLLHPKLSTMISHRIFFDLQTQLELELLERTTTSLLCSMTWGAWMSYAHTVTHCIGSVKNLRDLHVETPPLVLAVTRAKFVYLDWQIHLKLCGISSQVTMLNARSFGSAFASITWHLHSPPLVCKRTQG